MATVIHDKFEHHGALVGWTHEDLGDRVMVCLQSKRHGSAAGEADEMRYLMTKNQAAVLANHLFAASGLLPPPKRRRWFG
jgi:hypothetical protein